MTGVAVMNRPSARDHANCPNPHKRCYSHEAMAVAESIRLAPKYHHEPFNAYLCRCGWWHLTSKESWSEAAKARTAAEAAHRRTRSAARRKTRRKVERVQELATLGDPFLTEQGTAQLFITWTDEVATGPDFDRILSYVTEVLQEHLDDCGLPRGKSARYITAEPHSYWEVRPSTTS